MGLINSLFGTYSDRQIKKIMPVYAKVEALHDKYAAYSDAELRNVTPKLKERLAAGETLDDILPDAYAAVCEVFPRVLDVRLFRTQVIGGIVLHQGRIAEMKTGEGKTFTVALPAYLNALTGNGVHIITVNDYLAEYGYELMGKIFSYLGMTVGLVIHRVDPKERKKAYLADITYGTNNEFGFDYLRDNMVTYKEQMVQRGHHFAIIDEVDSILIDEARTPLIISGEGDKSTDLYSKADAFVKRLKSVRIKEMDEKLSYDEETADYIIDEKAKTAILTQHGIKKAEDHFKIENLADAENTELNHHINQALKAVGVMERDVDYVVKDNQVIIVDTFTGRLMPGRRYSDGLHQAIEAKENVKIEKESKTLATITFQNYFRLYNKLSGMTGTALTEESEFREIYNLDVVELPTVNPIVRVDHPDRVYVRMDGKFKAIVEQIKECNTKGQPILIGTVSVDKSEFLSALLKREGIKHTVLNAKYHEKEAEIVAQAGRFGSVTISTNMAGRGTDIMLGGNPSFMAQIEMKKRGYTEENVADAYSVYYTEDPEILAMRELYTSLVNQYKAEVAPEKKKVIDAGGLFILGTERHESRRIDNQLRGRSGRLGDPGESRFYLSMEDDLMRLFGSERVVELASRLGGDQPIDAKILSNTIENAQKRLEGTHFERRKNVLKYDDVLNQQRNIIYGQRREVLDGADLKERMISMIKETIETNVDTFCSAENKDEWNLAALKAAFFGYLTQSGDFDYKDEDLEDLTSDHIKEFLTERAMRIYGEKEELFGDYIREVERIILLRHVDEQWMDHIDVMSDLRDSIGLRAYAQRDPIVEYRMESAAMFDEVILSIKEGTVRSILSVMPKKHAEPLIREQVIKPMREMRGGENAQEAKRQPVVNKGAKVGRNDPCPCGSGKKYKKCCGFNANESD